MNIILSNLKPTYMSDVELSTSDIYLRPEVIFQQGKYYLINAQSGHGKSSLLNFIYGCNTSFQGSITFKHETETKSLSQNSLSNLRRQKLSYVFQDLKLFPELSVWDNIVLKNELTHFKTKEEILQMLKHCDLLHKKNQSVATLSIGQQQRVAIIRALCQPFQFLLLDEPFSHLDASNSLSVSSLINEELRSQKAGLIITSLGPSSVFDYNTLLNL